MKSHQIHGVMSLALGGITVILTAIAMFMTSFGLGVVYILIAAIAPMAIIYGFCAKCPCKEHCGHVFPGKLARLFTRPAGPYTSVEFGILGVAGLLLFGFPQVWLWQYPKLFVGFWGCSVIGLTLVLTFVCRACDNMYCPMNRQEAE